MLAIILIVSCVLLFAVSQSPNEDTGGFPRHPEDEAPVVDHSATPTIWVLTLLCIGTLAGFTLYITRHSHSGSDRTVESPKVNFEEFYLEDDKPSANESFAVASKKQYAQVVVECEDAYEIEYPVELTTEPANIAKDASGGKMLSIGPEKVNETEKAKASKRGHPDAAQPGYARIKFTVDRPAQYRIYVRAWWFDDCGNSIDISLDNESPISITGTVYQQWRWNLVKDGKGRPILFDLDTGEHEITLLNREDDLYVDQILFMDNKNPTIPSDDYITIEKEEANEESE